jgi:hypothetical protein
VREREEHVAIGVHAPRIPISTEQDALPVGDSAVPVTSKVVRRLLTSVPSVLCAWHRERGGDNAVRTGNPLRILADELTLVLELHGGDSESHFVWGFAIQA